MSKHRPGLGALRFLPVYFAAAILFFFLLWTIVSSLVPPQMPTLWQQALAEAIMLAAAIAPALVIARFEARRFGAYGLPARLEFARLVGAGGLTGLVALSVLLAALRIFGCVSFHGIHLHGVRVWKFALFWALFFSLVALFEEFAFRGYFLFSLSRAVGFWPAALISSAIFGYVHHNNRGETWLGALGAAAIGFFFSFTIRRCGNLWFAVGMHASWNWGQTFLYGVPDSGMLEPGHLFQASLYGPSWLSGGTVGPEGSVLLFVLITILWVLFARLYPRGSPGNRSGGGHFDMDEPAISPSGDYHQ
ncbi:MAG: CPBP family intramembrane metalloprotease [Acidobacteria bacterium]|nr:CPBP family intramembrane metalloprotease [Acidobacteriota bacterium]